MFNEVNLRKIQPILDRLNRTGYRLQVKPDTPLAHLVATVMPLLKTELTTDTLGQIAAGTAVKQTFGVGTEAMTVQSDPHELALETEVEFVGKVLSRQISIIRNHATPTIAEIFALCTDELQKERPIFWSLDIRRLHPLHQSVLWNELISPHAEQISAVVPLPSYFPEYSQEDLIAAMATGNQAFDAMLADMIAKHELTWVPGIYQQYFRTGGKYPAITGLENIDSDVIVFLLAKHFDDNPPAECPLTLSQYNAQITTVMAQAAVRIHNAYATWHNNAKVGRVVIKWPNTTIATQDNQTVIVHGPMFDELINRGGSADLIIGSLMAVREGNLEKLLEAKSSYLRHFQKYVTLVTDGFNNQIGARLKNILEVELTNKINTMPEDQRDPRFDQLQLIELMRRVLAIITTDELVEAPYQAVRSVVSAVLFSHVEAADILSRMDATTTQFPDLSMVEIAALVVEAKIVEYYRKQFDVVPMS